MGFEPSRRDDLESLGYILIDFLKGTLLKCWYFEIVSFQLLKSYKITGTLPWKNITAASKKELGQKIFEAKSSISVDILCKDVPIEFKQYLNYCKSLAYDEKPDYEYLRQCFLAYVIIQFQFFKIMLCYARPSPVAHNILINILWRYPTKLIKSI